jgi:hypothetical protein
LLISTNTSANGKQPPNSHIFSILAYQTNTACLLILCLYFCFISLNKIENTIYEEGEHAQKNSVYPFANTVACPNSCYAHLQLLLGLAWNLLLNKEEGTLNAVLHSIPLPGALASRCLASDNNVDRNHIKQRKSIPRNSRTIRNICSAFNHPLVSLQTKRRRTTAQRLQNQTARKRPARISGANNKIWRPLKKTNINLNPSFSLSQFFSLTEKKENSMLFQTRPNSRT